MRQAVHARRDHLLGGGQPHGMREHHLAAGVARVHGRGQYLGSNGGHRHAQHVAVLRDHLEVICPFGDPVVDERGGLPGGGRGRPVGVVQILAELMRVPIGVGEGKRRAADVRHVAAPGGLGAQRDHRLGHRGHI